MMSVLNRYERRRENTRARLKTAALELLYEKGYANLTVQEITDRADLGYGTFYIHYAEKDDLVWEILEALGNQFVAQIDAEVQALPSPRREYVSWVRFFEYAGANRTGYLSFFGKGGSVLLNQRMMAYLVRLHEGNMRAGRYSAMIDLPPEFVAQFIAGALWRLVLWWLETPGDRTPEQMASMLYRMVYRLETEGD
jgi:AcrR family transcriptional regulator